MQVSELKEHIKSLPITQVVGRYISLNKRGANHEALCPFHDDHSPSLKVNDSKGLYKCFVCGEAGDAISFVEKFSRKNFIEAIKEIGDNLGIEVEDNESMRKKKNPRYAMGLRILSSLEKLYYSYATSNQPKQYTDFIKNREIPENVRDRFMLGFAPAQNIAVKYLENKQKELPNEKIIDIALEIGVIKKTKYGLSDTFRNRITFPIWDHSGQVRGFGSRAITDDQVPKYLNSKESFLFNKKFLLYGFHLAKNTIRDMKSIILTEGYMDTIALNQEDFTNSVAIMGIALSDQKAQQISSQTATVYMAFDEDDAGFKAGERVSEKLLGLGVLAKKIDLTPHKDPDEFLKKMGKIEFLKRFETAKNFLDIQIEKATSKNFGDNTDLKLKALDEVFAILSPLKTTMPATERLLPAAKKLGLTSTYETLLENYQQFLKKNASPQPLKLVKNHATNEEIPVAEPTISPKSQNNQQNLQKPPSKQPSSVNKIDQWILKTALNNPMICTESRFTEILDFANNIEIKRFISDWGELSKNQGEGIKKNYSQNVVGLINEREFSAPFKNLVFSCLYGSEPTTDKEDLPKLIGDLRRKVEVENLKLRRVSLMSKRSNLIDKNEIEKVDIEVMELNKKILLVKNQKEAQI